MNLNQLRVFHAIARYGSVSEAARQLHISQPAVSKQLAELESSVGAPLVDRLPRGVRLTQIGHCLQEHAERLFEIERTAEAELEELLGNQKAKLSLGASTTIGSYLVPSLFATLRRMHPEVELALHIGNTKTIHEMVRHDQVDLGLTEGLMPEDDLISTDFSEDEVIAVTAPTDALLHHKPITLEKLLTQPILVREPGSGTREVLESALAARGYSMRLAMELGSNEAVKNAVVHRLGIAFLSRLALDLELRSGRLVQIPLEDFSLRRKLHLIELRHRVPTPLITTFKTLLARPQAHLRATEYAI